MPARGGANIARMYYADVRHAYNAGFNDAFHMHVIASECHPREGGDPIASTALDFFPALDRRQCAGGVMKWKRLNGPKTLRRLAPDA